MRKHKIEVQITTERSGIDVGQDQLNHDEDAESTPFTGRCTTLPQFTIIVFTLFFGYELIFPNVCSLSFQEPYHSICPNIHPSISYYDLNFYFC